MKLSTIAISLFFIIGFGLVIYGVLYKPKIRRMMIASSEGVFNKQCKAEKVSCNTDTDCREKCTESQEGEEMVCQALPPISQLTEKQKQIMNVHAGKEETETAKFCVPSNALPSMNNCNFAHGGIPVFSGWSGISDRMEFDCLCAYPEWANSRICDPDTGACEGNCVINPDICRGGELKWDLSKKVQPPIAQLCECAEGDVLMIDNAGLPRCVPKDIQSFYDDLDISTGIRGGQELIGVVNVPLISLNKTQRCQSCQCCSGSGCDCSKCENKYTLCPEGCCMTEGGVCCTGEDGDNFCCPKGYHCDVANRRCTRDSCCPQSDGTCKAGCCKNETTCAKGCCPIPEGKCCGDGSFCCPPNFPMCDLKNKTCNPTITQMVPNSKCEVGDGNTQCVGGCCPFTDGTCCGEFCCPSEYPFCDIENKMCKMFP
jgi:hypothetical protein